ncbi:MAG: hypothetical protein J5741_05170 [Bacteroidales bacterium]|nr:hypothetical protein [Bacteroidales bacterium]
MIHVFNPEHDYALANNGPHFVPPESAIRFARDCAPFLCYLMDQDDLLFQPYDAEKPFLTAQGLPADNPNPQDDVSPWGWDALVLRQLRSKGFCLDDRWTDYVQHVRELAHRRHTIHALEHLQKAWPSRHLPEFPKELTSAEDAERYIQEHHDVIFKSPYSGNGRGHLYAHGECSPTLTRQITGVIRRQASIMAEPMYHILQDFAMEFVCQSGEASFAGYSLFSTLHYGYAHNELCSDAQIVDTLSQWIPKETLETVKESLITYLNQTIAPYYSGCVGIDMCVYDNDGIHLHPMIEINLRMTMGMAAHRLYERHIHPSATGIMCLEYRPKGLSDYLQQQSEQEPLKWEDGLWRSGFHVLTPIHEETQYAVCVQLS